MDALRQWLRQIIGYLILSSLIQNLIPKKDYEPYIRLFLNLLLVLMLISPLLSVSRDSLGDAWLEAAASVSQGMNLEADLRMLNEKQTSLESFQQQALIREEISRLLEEKGYTLSELSVTEDEDGVVTGIQVTAGISPLFEYQGIQEGQEMRTETVLEEYLKEQLDTSCSILVELTLASS